MIVLPLLCFNRACAGQGASMFSQDAEVRKIIENAAMEAVIAREKALGHEPRDVSADKIGYDIWSLVPETSDLRFIEVKGRRVGADTVMITRQELITSLNKPETSSWLLSKLLMGSADTPLCAEVPSIRGSLLFDQNAIQFNIKRLLEPVGGTVMTGFAILAPVPLEHLNAGLDIVAKEDFVAFGSRKFELFRAIDERRMVNLFPC